MAISVLSKRDELGVKGGQLYIDGAWCDASDGGTWTHVNPAANEEIATFAIGTAADVDRAVLAARRAFDEGPWPRMKARERRLLMQKVVALIVDRFGHSTRGGGKALDPATVRRILERTATDHACPAGGVEIYTDEGRPAEFNAPCVGTTAENSLYGEGIVNATRAVR